MCKKEDENTILENQRLKVEIAAQKLENEAMRRELNKWRDEAYDGNAGHIILRDCLLDISKQIQCALGASQGAVFRSQTTNQEG